MSAHRHAVSGWLTAVTAAAWRDFPADKDEFKSIPVCHHLAMALLGRRRRGLTHVDVHLNARLQPVHRGELYEDPLDQFLRAQFPGSSVVGGGPCRTRRASSSHATSRWTWPVMRTPRSLHPSCCSSPAVPPAAHRSAAMGSRIELREDRRPGSVPQRDRSTRRGVRDERRQRAVGADRRTPRN